ncbi:S-layer glycoprotein N-glycosyltransferase AglJ [Methanolobus sediminis]|uniref:S-layer glycoprotein N-glycosyltransferase AglJ n=1 Tax=Methanolobus sediminis TaxID=3072978 RepID=A0AA51UM87_9EURY|nr:S-layer glycoprotein N-glycosyltransferase AglJ [Methanolobus sediminis]WMW26198.1 S-layer glycoprotein N-glycosyltransferase AglJ [Methanolobus sediminis]
MSNENVCILLPTLNEEATIGQVIRDFRSEGFDNILVIDGNSKDKTREIAEAEGARVVVQTGKGKGQAIKQAFELIEEDYVVMADGDGTNLAKDVHAVLGPVLEGKADHVMGNRLVDYEQGAFTRLNLFGNKVINKMFGMAYGVWLEDILTGYRAFNKKAIKSFELKKMGFEVESEITIDSVKKDLRILEVPTTYLARSSQGATKLNPLKDGFRIVSTIYKMAKLHNPMFYFGIIGGMLIVAGLIVGTYVVHQWLHGITRIPMTILTTLLVVAGFQMFIFGMLSDLMVALHRENMRMLRKISEKDDD